MGTKWYTTQCDGDGLMYGYNQNTESAKNKYGKWDLTQITATVDLGEYLEIILKATKSF